MAALPGVGGGLSTSAMRREYALRIHIQVVLVAGILCLAAFPIDQPTAPTRSRLFLYSGHIANPISRVVEISFAMYDHQQGGLPLWVEHRQVTPEDDGSYTIILGEHSPESAQPTQHELWVVVTVDGEPQSARQRVDAVAYGVETPVDTAEFVPASSATGVAKLGTPSSREMIRNTASAPLRRSVHPEDSHTRGVPGNPNTVSSGKRQGAPSAGYLFGRAQFAIPALPTGSAYGDFDGDGRLDLAVASGSVYVLLGNPDGTLAQPVEYPAGSNAYAILAGDFNNDGILDIAVSNYSQYSYQGQSVSVLLGNGDGTFQSPRLSPTGSLPQGIAAGDFNGDGVLDLAVTDNTDTLLILVGRGDGTFYTGPTYLPDRRPTQVTAGDLNADGKLDLVLTPGSPNGNFATVMLGNGDGTFSGPFDYPTASGPRIASIADINKDGIPDLVVATDQNLSILFGNGDGTFRNNIDTFLRVFSSSLVVGDFNRDGTPDVAIGSTNPGSLAVLLGNGDGTFLPPTEYPGPSTPLLAADLNGDGQLDLIGTGYGLLGTPVVNVQLGDGDGTFTSRRDYVTGVDPVDAGVADFNHDGKLDIAVVNQNCPIFPCGPGYASIFLGKGDGTFEAKSVNTVGTVPWPMGIADFNHDTIPDIAVGNHNDGTFSVLIGNGDGTFHPHVDFMSGSLPNSLAIGDYNGDGLLDLALGTGNGVYGWALSVVLANGYESFLPPVYYNSPSTPKSVITADFNHDGKLDLAALNFSSGGVSVFLGNGDGTFQAQKLYDGGDQALKAADFNGDGILDLASIDFFGGQVDLGNGDGTFQPGIPLPFGGVALGVGDLNEDGKQDLVLSGAILFGNGDGTFNIQLGPPAVKPIVADLNGDGHPDLVTLNQSFGNIPYVGGLSLYLNLPEIALFPVSLNFKREPIGATSQPMSIQVSNPTMVPLTLSSVSVTGDFAQTSDCPMSPASVPAGGTCQVMVTFTPDSAGKKTGRLELFDNSPGGHQVLTLSGSGASAIKLSSGSLALGIEDVGITAPPVNLTISNVGGSAVAIAGIVIEGPQALDFHQSNNCGSSLAAGQQCTITVTFTPSNAGARYATIRINDTDPYSPQRVNMRGVGRRTKPR